jgi:6-phosphogluconolactonase
VTEPEIVVVADPESAATAAAGRIVSALDSAIMRRARADWATTGGSAPVLIYRRLVEPPLLDAVDWGAVHVWWGDDRYVPRDHPSSNVKPFEDVMLDFGSREEGTAGGFDRGVRIAPDHVHPFPTGEAIGRGRGAAWCAATLADELRAAGLPEVDGWPAFDLLLLGVGGDGHILSVFPGSPALDSTELALAIPAPTHIEPHLERVTLNPAVVGAARVVLVVVTGADKAEVVATVLGRERDPRRWPSQLARRSGATWILDEAAAAALPARS